MLCRLLVVAATCCVFTARVTAYSFTGTRWTGSNATLHLQLGSTPAPLLDGATSWGAAAENALAVWNAQLASFRFGVQRDSTAAKAQGNRVNNVHFAPDIYGQSWGGSVLAVTLTYSIGTSNTETDVVFNSGLNWNSYRGSLRYTSTGQPMYDFHRVALHEFGHALGLDHPDENGQSVTALMNSRISALDSLTSDDIGGGQALYGAATSTPPVVAPPTITLQPAGRTVTAGQPTTFTVAASSTVAMTYQWFKAGVPIAGATASSYTIGSVTATHAGNYHATVANSGGTTTSAVATLTVTQPPTTTTTPPPTTTTPTSPAPAPAPAPSPAPAPVATLPTITSQPIDRIVTAGSSFTLSVSASGTAPLAYQWRKDGFTLPGATSGSYSISAANVGHGGSYVVIVSNSAGSVSSVTARVTVGSPPTFVTQPGAQTIAVGTPLTLSATVADLPAPNFQWFKDGSPVAAATSATYSLPVARTSDAGVYRVTATNAFGSTSSANATVTVHSLPVVTSAPGPQTVNAGERVQFSVGATGTPAPAFQWLRNGAEIAGATSSTLVLAAVRPSDGGTYAVRVSNAVGSVFSSGAALTVRHSRLVNLSTRAFLPAGGTLTPGFFVRGQGAKPLLIRAVGPTLASFGVATAIGEARLELIAQATGQTLAAGGDWGGATALRNAFVSVGAFPLAADSKDAAVQAELGRGGYTARIAPGDAQLAGVTLAEIYDAGDADPATQLVNLSTLGFVGSGENALTAGFVISGNAPKRVLIRAVGPGLAQFGVGSLLTDPQLGLVPQGRSEPVATNDDWPDLSTLHAAFTSAGAFPLTVGSKDAALVITLEPGAYTVVVSGVSDGSSGNALVEIYDLDP